MPQGSAFCTSCGTSFAAQPAQPAPQPTPQYIPPAGGGGVAAPAKKPLNKKLLMMIGGGVLAAAAITIALILIFGGNRIVGTWDFVAEEEFRNGMLVDRWDAGSWDTYSIQFNRDGTGVVMHGFGDTEMFSWVVSGNILTITNQWGHHMVSSEFRISGRELRTINRDEWWGDVWEEHMIYRRR